MSLAAYDAKRDDIRKHMIEVRRRRRVQIGPRVSLGFENRETVIYQVHEMLHAERISEPARIEEELATYNDLLPNQNELSATLFIEVPDAAVIRETLNLMIGVDELVRLRLGDWRGTGQSEPGRSTLEKTASVHYVRFPLGAKGAQRLREASLEDVEFEIDHPHYTARTGLHDAQLKELQADVT